MMTMRRLKSLYQRGDLDKASDTSRSRHIDSRDVVWDRAGKPWKGEALAKGALDVAACLVCLSIRESEGEMFTQGCATPESVKLCSVTLS